MTDKQKLLTQKKILLVDDDIDFCWTINNVLTHDGYNVIQAHDGNQALGLLKKDDPRRQI